MLKKIAILLILGLGSILIILGGWRYLNRQKSQPGAVSQPAIQNIKPMQITSPAFEPNQNIPVKYTCDGEGVNPPLAFADIPAQTASLALIVDDPDAPMAPPAGGWTHWTVWNIAPDTTSIAENSAPIKSTQGQTSSGQNVYGGPCPPGGQHRYFFKLFALDAKLSIPSFSTVDKLTEAMSGHILARAELTGLYSRSDK